MLFIIKSLEGAGRVGVRPNKEETIAFWKDLWENSKVYNKKRQLDVRCKTKLEKKSEDLLMTIESLQKQC